LVDFHFTYLSNLKKNSSVENLQQINYQLVNSQEVNRVRVTLGLHSYLQASSEITEKKNRTAEKPEAGKHWVLPGGIMPGVFLECWLVLVAEPNPESVNILPQGRSREVRRVRYNILFLVDCMTIRKGGWLAPML
jgi:hypothetical protein